MLPGFFLLCDDAHAACCRLGLTKHVLRDCCHLDHDQHDSQFSAALVLGACVLLCRSIGTHCSRKTPSHFVVLLNLQEDEGML